MINAFRFVTAAPTDVPGIYWCDSGTDKIQRSDHDGSNVTDLVTTGLSNPRYISVTNSYIYWTDALTNIIQRSDLNGNNVTDLVTGANNPLGIAVTDSYIYWTEPGVKAIVRCDLDGSNEVIINSNAGEQIAGIGVTSSYIFWMDRNDNYIYRSDLVGNNVIQVVFVSDGVDITATESYVYWADSGFDRISRCEHDGSNVTILYSFPGSATPTGIDVNESYIYWTDILTDKIQRCDLDGNNVTDLVTTGLALPYGIAVTPLPLNYTWTQIGSDINGTGVGDQTGYRVDLNDAGDIVAMTSPFNTDGGADSGEIRVFERSGNSWIQVGSDIEGAPGEYPINSGNGLHSVALNGAGDVIATGWPGNDEFGAGNNDSGQVRVYKNVSNTWTLTGGDINPLGSDERLGANEGVSLNTEGNIVAVGSWLGGDQSGFSDPGVVRVFEMNAGTWSQIGQTLSGETTGVSGEYNQSADYFGQSARLNGAGDILVVGAPGNDNNNYPSLNYAGHVRVFRYNTGTWNQIGSDIDGGAAELQFGFSTSINTTGNIIAVGGYGSASNTGIVRIFENIADTWTQIGSDIVGVDANDRTGYSVSLNGAGDIVAVGDVIHDNVSGTNIGRMRTFKNVAGVWEELAPEVTGLAASEFAGASVALNKVGDITAVGVIGTSTGSVRMYSGGFS